MLVAFEKWHGCHNDFLVTWLSDQDGEVVLNSFKRQAKALCDRRSGIGADGLLVLHTRSRSDLTPYGLTIINSDGSLAATCGNGLRCAACSVRKAHKERGNPDDPPEMVEFIVEGASLQCRFPAASDAFVIVDMGVPTLGRDLSWYDAGVAAVLAATSAAGLHVTADDLGFCEIGNAHVVISSAKASRDLVLKLGPGLQKASVWDGINVHLIRPGEVGKKDQATARQQLGREMSELYEAFVWERGAGETMACGSGVCAIGATQLASGLLPRSAWVAVDMPGGRLYTKQDAAAATVSLAGPATFVFSGKVTI